MSKHNPVRARDVATTPWLGIRYRPERPGLYEFNPNDGTGSFMAMWIHGGWYVPEDEFPALSNGNVRLSQGDPIVWPQLSLSSQWRGMLDGPAPTFTGAGQPRIVNTYRFDKSAVSGNLKEIGVGFGTSSATRQPVPLKDEVWTTRDGRKVFVCDMKGEHARNALRMVLRRVRIKQAKLDALKRAAEEEDHDGYHGEKAYS